MIIGNKEKIVKYSIYIGLNDSETYQQKFETEKYMHIVENVLRSYKTGFSIGQNIGGYFHEDGTFVRENSLVITLIGADEQLVNDAAADLCAFFNQEEVIVSVSEEESYYIKENISF